MRQIFGACLLGLSMLTITNLTARAEVTLPGVLASHMVMQRDRPVHLWGMADPGENVSVTFRDNHASATADKLGQWSLYLPPVSAGGPFTLTIQGKNTITLDDVLVGDVWIASGQSNMQFPMDPDSWSKGPNNAASELAAANYPKLRLYHVKDKASDYPMSDAAATTWTACTPQSVADFSAVAYLFGREIIQREKVPIGLVESDWGGTPAEAWTSLGALSADASLMPVFAARAHMMQEESSTLLEEKNEQQQIAAATAAGKQPPAFPWRPDPASWGPAALYNAMIAPLTPLPIRGVIWYQGESNTDDERAPIYGNVFQTMIRDWRMRWGQGDFPFLYVQIANFNAGDGWATVREAQRQTLSLKNTGMAVAIDVGSPNNVHPRDKQDVGHRLALWARDLSYGEQVEDSGPLFRQAVPKGGQMRVWFDHAGSGLMAKGGDLKSFEVAGMDGKFSAANARIDGDTIVVSSPSIAAPAYVRYGWAGNPECNLYNRDNLPASPFTSFH